MAKKIPFKKLIEEFNLKLINDVDDEIISNIEIIYPKLNRLGLQLTGFFNIFPNKRIQIIGKTEKCYINQQNLDFICKNFQDIVSKKIPCIIFTDCQKVDISRDFIEIANNFNVPLFSTDIETTDFMIKFFEFYNINTIEEKTINGVLVDINGVGTLVLGKSGIGKSEAVLELIKRGHRFVADDSVIVKKVNPNKLSGKSPELIKNLMEIRGIGIVDIAKLYGIGSVIDEVFIDFVVKIEERDLNKEYDRLGIDEEYINIMGIDIPIITIPVMHGRNLAVILEAAARNYSLKKRGFNAARELDNRLKNLNN